MSRVQDTGSCEPEMIDVLDIFKEEAYENDESGEVVLKGPSGHLKSLDSLRLHRREAKVTLRLPLLLATCDLSVYVFGRRRDGSQMVFWPVSPLYSLFGLSSYKGYSSVWIEHSVDRWRAYLDKAVGCDFVMFSTHGNTSEKKLMEVPM